MSLYITDETMIHAPASVVWKALIRPEYTMQYMFNCPVVCDWNIGDRIEWIDRNL